MYVVDKTKLKPAQYTEYPEILHVHRGKSLMAINGLKHVEFVYSV